jgi:hypothetical protein
MICGGTGFDLTTFLPIEIDSMKPKINIGFTTRGCIRNCPFCVVPKKEGRIKIVGDIYDFWDGRTNEIKILDNNILAVSNHFKTVCNQIKKESLKVDFCQGLDVRLITEELAYYITSINHTRFIRIAWDNIEDEKGVLKGIKNLLKYINPYKIMCYVLIGYNTSKDEDLYRVTRLRELGIDLFIMSYNKYDSYQKKFARWVNHKAIFKTVAWEDYRQ